MIAQFDRFEIRMTRTQAGACSHPGPCDAEVADLLKMPSMIRQLDEIGPDKIRAELKEYGAWDPGELADDEQNRRRIIWIAAGNISDKMGAAR